MKLWKKKGAALDPEAEAYTVGMDHMLDLELVPYDIRASKAHARMLEKRGYLSRAELKRLLDGLDGILQLHSKGRFTIRKEDEDCHTAIENHLVKELGDAGRRIHTARSRNDQSMAALRLYMLDRLDSIAEASADLGKALKALSRSKAPMPGYTHMRKAMPSSVGMLFSAYADMIDDDLALIRAVRGILDSNPLGSAAGYGLPIPIDRQMTAKELGFSRVQENPIHCANSRGRYESLVVSCMLSLMQSLNRMASDLLLFSMPEFGYFLLPASLCTGSSIMPQKRNPDVLELVRANAHVVHGDLVKIDGIVLNLPSGYNRDYQLTKGPLMESIGITLSSVRMMTKVVAGLGIDEDALGKAMTGELHAVEKAYQLVKGGMPFREAYKKVAEDDYS